MTQPPTGTPVQRVEVSLLTTDSKGEEKPATISGTVSERWTKASDSVQTTAKWVITALAAVGAVMFAKGFVSVPTLSFTEDRGQLLLAWALGIMGVIGIGILIWATSQVLFPTILTLRTLPTEFKELVARDPEDFLPTGADTVDGLGDRLLEHRKDLAFAEAAIHTADLGLKDHAADAERAKQEVQVASEELDDAEQQNPPVEGKIAEARTALQEAVARQREATERVEEAEKNLASMRRQLGIIKSNVDLYVSKRQEVLDRAQFWKTSTNYLHGSSRKMFVGAALAAIGGIGFQLALTTPPEDDSSGDGSAGSAGSSEASFPRTAHLVQLESEASAALWDAAGLTSCQLTTEETPTVPVILLAGKGTASDPWSISTIPTDTCPLRTFPVLNDVALVVEEPNPPITYTPAPTTSPTATTTD